MPAIATSSEGGAPMKMTTLTIAPFAGGPVGGTVGDCSLTA